MIAPETPSTPLLPRELELPGAVMLALGSIIGTGVLISLGGRGRPRWSAVIRRRSSWSGGSG